jgi:cytochrome bd-type quinol oxidase subunit 1
VLGRQPFVVTPVMPVSAKVISSTSIRKKPVIAALLVFIIWCIGTLVVLPRMRLRGRLPSGAEPA